MAEDPSKDSPGAKKQENASIGEIVDLVREYAKQETLGPLKGAGRWLALGALGSTLLGIGCTLLLVAVLRLLQTEVSVFDGAFSWVPYVVVLVLSLLLTGLALSRIKKATLGKEPN